MASEIEKRFLQTIVGIACLVPILGGAWGIWRGAGNATSIDFDSQYHYLSGLLMGVGLTFATAIPNIEKHAARFRILTSIVVLGGLSRLAALLLLGMPSNAMRFALGMEIVVTPLLYLWQNHFARRYHEG